jgi:hypothetical protein
VRYRGRYDVVVAGGGTSGAIAAIAAARAGARTLLIERYGSLGGVLSLGMAILGAADGEGYVVLGGIGAELLTRLVPVGGATPTTPDEQSGSVTGQDPELLKLELLRMVREAGVEILLHAFVVDVANDGRRCTGLVLAHKAGLELVCGDAFVDCTGDADLVARCDGEVIFGREEDGRAQPASRIFRVGGVDLERLWRYLAEHPEDHDAPEGWTVPPFELEHLRRTPGASMDLFAGLIRRARAAGDFSIPRDRIGIDTFPGRKEVTVNLTRVHNVDGTDPDSLTAAEIQAQLQMLEALMFLRRYVPGFERAQLVSSPFQIGVRETRRIRGHYILTLDDVSEGATFDDQVGLGAYPIDVHRVDPGEAPDDTGGGVNLRPIARSYGIPMRALIPADLENIAVGGRCISATHRAAASVRGQAVCMVTGHAAGVIAAEAAGTQSGLMKLSPASVQASLEAQGAILARSRRLAAPDATLRI